MCRLIIENRHLFEDIENSAPKHGHIVYQHIENEDDEDSNNLDAGEKSSDGLTSDELKTSSFNSKTEGYSLIEILLEKGIININEADEMDNEIDHCLLPLIFHCH